MRQARSRHTATLMYGDYTPRFQKVVIVGGYNETDGYLATAELYFVGTGGFRPTGAMITPRFQHTATLVTAPAPILQKLLIAGGVGNTGYLASAELFDLTYGRFNATGGMAIPRVTHSATLLPTGTVLILGGLNTPSSGSAVAFASAELYDLVTGTFTSARAMATARAEHSATLLPTGKVLVAGGEIPSIGALATAELY